MKKRSLKQVRAYRRKYNRQYTGVYSERNESRPRARKKVKMDNAEDVFRLVQRAYKRFKREGRIQDIDFCRRYPTKEEVKNICEI